LSTEARERYKAVEFEKGATTVELVQLRTLFAVRVHQLMFALCGAVRIDTLGNRVAVDAEGFSGVGNALFITRESLLDVQLFEFFEGLIQKNAAIQHLFNNSF
jgi:hypothetical protein